MCITVAVPALRIRESLPFDPCEGLELNALRELLGRGTRQPLNADSFDQWLRERFGAHGVGVAETCRRVDLPGSDNGYWLRADPVHLRPDRDRVMLYDAGILQLCEAESQALLASLNSQFAGDGIRFFSARPDRWYAQFDVDPQLETSPLGQVVGQDIHPRLPKGPDALKWHRLLNEIQMFLYTHAVNDARDMSGKPLANSVWFWGEGTPPGRLTAPFAAVFADDPWVRGLGDAAGLAVQGMSNSFSDGVALANESLTVIDDLALSAMRGDIHAWREALQALEHRWFGPMLSAWRRGQIDMISLILPAGADVCEVRLRGGDRWKFWRRPVSSASLAT